MIQVEQYIKSLLPNFESKRIYNDLERITAEYAETVLPVYRSTTEAFKATKFSVPVNKQFTAEANKYLPSFKGTIHESVYAVLLKVPGKMKVLEELVKEYYGTYVTNEGMTYARINVLQMVEIMDFTAMYARRLLLTMYGLETTPFEDRLKDRAFAREVSWLMKGSQAFYKCLEIIDMKDRDFEQKFKYAKDIIIQPGGVADAAAVIGARKLDPLATGFIAFQWSPIYHLRVALANWQFARSETARAEKEAIELYLIQLREQRSENKNSPKLAKQIAYNEGRLLKLRKKLNDMEEDARDD